jgi:hypothetical protein
VVKYLQEAVMKNYLLLILVWVSFGCSMIWAQQPGEETLSGQKMLLRPHLQSVDGECYYVANAKDYIVFENELIEISYGYEFHGCDPGEVNCISTNQNIVANYKKWQNVFIDAGVCCYNTQQSYFFKVVGKGECDIILKIDGKSYTYHIIC